MMMKPNKWDIWLASIKFEEKPDIKNRPVLVIAPDMAYYVSLKITTHEPRNVYSNEHRIVKWEEAGLNKPSTIRASKVLHVMERDFVHKIGHLHPVDIMAVQKILERNF
ncbi:MAG: type II toxin-antitoxin system PemK/MazF family toxin [Methanocorpusculum sp.]|jgi:mRNA-degrading endonuclease toxin of MazEF toxin-antitoxin module|nr:type II toxin-antitoxin system PemK/MazF family toxin [Methanocorpusculum sp.]